MKQQNLLRLGLLGVALWLAASAKAQLAPKPIYGLYARHLDAELSLQSGFGHFDNLDPETLTIDWPLSFSSVTSGAEAHGLYYYYEYSQESVGGYKSIGFYELDPETGDLRTIADYGLVKSTIFSCLTYDYSTETMYCIDGMAGGTRLCKLNMDDGTLQEVGRFKGLFAHEDYPEYGDTFKAMACNYDGEMYGVTYWGRLYKINKYTADADLIGTLDYNPEIAFMYNSGNLFFDNETDECYWMFYTFPNRYELRRLDLKTAHSERIYTNPQWGFFGAYIPFLAAEASAPAKAQNVQVTPAGEGQLQATLTWDNPSRTFGRNGTLEELDSIVVFRNNERQVCFTDVTIGGAMQWTDTNITRADYYTYKIIGYNNMGRGDRVSVAAYVGHGTPKPVEQIYLQSEGDYAKVMWKPVTLGLYDAWIDQESLVYDLVRLPDGHRIEGICDTHYTDTVPTIERYTYQIYARNADATSTVTTSNSVVCGPAFTVPHQFDFLTQEEFLQWETFDNNGDGVNWYWSMGMEPTRYVDGAYIFMSDYDPMAAWDWLISPAVRLEAGVHYKVEFQAKSYSGSQPETLSVSLGTTQSWESQDSLTTFNWANLDPVQLRFNLPVLSETGNRHIGFLARSVYQNWCMSVGHVRVSEDHDGTLQGQVLTAEGEPLFHAIVATADSAYAVYTEADGSFRFDYLPQGQYTIVTSYVGYQNDSTVVNIAQYETTTLPVTLQHVPAHTLTGRLIDMLGDPIEAAEVHVTGYNEYLTTTDADGRFSIPGVFEFTDYTIRAHANRMIEWCETFDVTSDIDFGTITLADNLLAPRQLQVEATDELATLSWIAPANDPQYFRYDDGTVVNSLGVASGTPNSVFGTIFRTPMTLKGAKFYIAPSQVEHTSVHLYVFDLDEQGQPLNNKILYHNDYVPCVVGDWTEFDLKTDIECPRGCYLALASTSFLSLAIDGAGDREQYPFVPGVNCYSGDYTQGLFYLDNTDYRSNFLVRAYGSPYALDEAEAAALQFVRPGASAQGVDASAQRPELTRCFVRNAPFEAVETTSGARHTPVSARTYYNVYRFTEAQAADPAQWTQVCERTLATSYADTQWATLPQGIYYYAVCASYAGGQTSAFVTSDLVGRLMTTSVSVKAKTNTPDNEIEDATLLLQHADGQHFYQGVFDWKGSLVLDGVWKGQYTLTLSKPGFGTISQSLDLGTESAYSFEYELIESLEQPRNLLLLDEGANDERELVWNFPDQLYDDFEEHEDFMIGSPGTLGWQYIDGDQSPVGGFSVVEFPHAFEPMSFILFNNAATNPPHYFSFMDAHSGDKCLASFAAYERANDDWLISPRLYFQQEFKFAFWAKSMEGGASREVIQVGYTTATQPDPETFEWVKAEQKVSNNWTRYSFNIPAEAKYVCIHHISDGLYVLLIDDVAIGLKNGFPTQAPQRQGSHRSPSLDGQYEVWLDGQLVGQTDDTRFLLTRLTTGQHTVGVRGSYTSGYTEMTTLDFYVENGWGIETIHTDRSAADRHYDVLGRPVDAQKAQGRTVIGPGSKSLTLGQ